MTCSREYAAREKEPPALLSIGSMSPPGYPSAWLHPCISRFRFTRRIHCSCERRCLLDETSISAKINEESKRGNLDVGLIGERIVNQPEGPSRTESWENRDLDSEDFHCHRVVRLA
jgi:hypothetical protein